MLSPIQQAAGLGNPSEPFYTNEIESINRIIKRKTGKLAKELIDEQKIK